MSEFFKRGRHWPLFVVGLVVLNLGATIVLLVMSNWGTHAVEPDYYRKAINWDQNMSQQRTNHRLGWVVDLAFERGAVDARSSRIPETTVVLRPKTRLGRPIKGAQVKVEAYARLRAERRKNAIFKERRDGSYALPLRLWPTGLWRFDVSVKQGRRLFTVTIDQDIPRLF